MRGHRFSVALRGSQNVGYFFFSAPKIRKERNLEESLSVSTKPCDILRYI